MVILDVIMQGMSGFSLYKKIRKLDDKVPICFLTEYRPKQQIIEVSTEGEQVSPEQQADDNVIDRSTEGEPCTMQHANKLKQQDDIPTTANDVEAVKENEETVTAEPVLTINNEYASIMPALYDLEYGSLKSSIQVHGQPFPTVVNQDGVILDGHHRYKACHELGIKPSVLVRQFENRLQEKKFIIEVNRSRRHLNEFQRIELQIKLESIESEIAKERMSHKIGA